MPRIRKSAADRKRRVAWGVAALIWLGGCVGRTSSPVSGACGDLERFFRSDLDSFQNRVDEASRAYSVEQWRIETADPGASAENLSRLFSDYQKQIYDAGILERVRHFSKVTSNLKSDDCVWTAKLARVRKILEADILTRPAVVQREKKNQDLQDAIERQSNSFRLPLGAGGELVSKTLFLKRLASQTDRSKRAAMYRQWNSARAKMWMRWGFRDLIVARNEEAKLMGFPTYYEYRFFRNHLDFSNYRALTLQLKTALVPPLKKWIQRWGKTEKIDKVAAWDLGFIRERAGSGAINEWMEGLPESFPLDAARGFYARLGFPIDDYQFTMDLWPRAGKTAHAFAFTVVYPHVDRQGHLLSEPKPDIRFLANLKVPLKWEDVRTVIHELGHAVHSAEVRQPAAIFRGTDSLESEAIAQFFERIAGTSEFLESAFPHRSGGRAQGILARQARASQWEQAYTLLRQVFYGDFEYELYHRPEAEPAELWAKMHEEYWGVEVKPSEAGWDVEHFLMAPVYVQNYALGVLIVEQLKEYFEQGSAKILTKEVGDKLRSVYFAPGTEFGYLEMVERFTGKPLSVEAALKLVRE